MSDGKINYAGQKEYVPYVVKRIGGHLYVYEQFRVGDKVITKYVGPFDKIVRFYIENHRAEKPVSSGAGAGIRTRAGLSQRSLSEGQVRLSRRARRELEAVKRFLTNAEIEEFFRWLVKDRDPKYARNIIGGLRRLDLSRRYSILGLRLFARYLSERYGLEFHYLLGELRVPRTGVDLRVPSEEEVARSISMLSGGHLSLYLLLLASGIRLSEAQRVLADMGNIPYREYGGVRVYTVNWQRGQKAVFYVFTPEWLSLRQARVRWDSQGPHRKIPAKPKYVRKFFATKCFELGVPAEVIDFIQGRTPRSVLTRHYLNLLPRAIQEYRKYAGWLREFLSQQ